VNHGQQGGISMSLPSPNQIKVKLQ